LKALVIVDMQEAYIGEKSKYRYLNKKELIGCINQRIKKASIDTIIIYIKNARKGVASELVSGLSIVSDLVFVKGKSSCFSNSEFIDCLVHNNVNELEIVGIDGDVCVKHTAIDGVNRGFAVTIPLSCIGVINKERFLRTREIFTKWNIQIVE